MSGFSYTIHNGSLEAFEQLAREAMTRLEALAEERHDSYISVNVKMPYEYVYIESILERLNIPAGVARDKIMAEFGEQQVSAVYDMWLEVEREGLINVLHGCQVSSEKWWSENVEPKLDSATTPYPALNEITDRAARRAEFEKWVAKDTKIHHYITRVLDPKHYHFGGRSGGWLHLEPVSRLREARDNIEAALETLQAAYDSDYLSEYLEAADTLTEDINTGIELAEALDWAINEARAAHSSLDFRHELAYRVAEFIESCDKYDLITTDNGAALRGVL